MHARNLREDLKGETVAAQDYTTRLQQFKGTKAAPVLREIRNDEQDHHRKVKKLIRQRPLRGK